MLRKDQAGENENYRQCVKSLTPLLVDKAIQALKTKNDTVEKRKIIESQIRRIITEHKTAADTICTAIGSIENTSWTNYSHWLNSTAILYVEPRSSERTIMSSSFIDTVSENTNTITHAILNDIKSGAKLYLADNKKQAKQRLIKLDRNYQALTEVFLFELGIETFPNNYPLSTKIKEVRFDSRSTWYCNETKYQTSTIQNLGR